jgi:hypothetical protein
MQPARSRRHAEEWVPRICAVIYPVQFEDDPRDGCERVARLIVSQRPLGYGPEEYVAALQQALASDADLSRLIPQDHADAALRGYMRALRSRLERELAARKPTLPGSSGTSPGVGLHASGDGRR